MKKSFLWLSVLIGIGLFSCDSGGKVENASLLPYKDKTLSTTKRVDDLLKRMTVEEKIGQLYCLLGWEMYQKDGSDVKASAKLKEAINKRHIGMLWATLRADPWTRKTLETGLNPGLAAKATNAMQQYAVDSTRLGIPLLLAEECAHGHMAIGTTVFPTSLGQASTFDTDLIEKMSAVIGKETRLQGAHIGYGPILDLAREPRWSRMEETYGEDPYLIAQMGRAMVKGFQGDDLKSGNNIVSTLKHFVAYGTPIGGHNGASVGIGERDLYANVLPPFQAAVDQGALSIMTSYNSVDGVPCTANKFLLTDLLRDQWNYDGFVVSDLGSISGLIKSHRIAATKEEAGAISLEAGVDVDLGGYGFDGLEDALKQGMVKMSAVDQAVKRVLKIKFDMGLFENPYVDAEKAKNEVHTEKDIELANKVAKESIVLLKNENGILPLSKDIKRIAVIGPNADNMYNQLGDYTAPQPDNNVVTVLEAIQNKLPDANIRYVKGCGIRDMNNTNIPEAVRAVRYSDVAVVVLGGSSARDFKTKYETTGAASVAKDDSKKAVSDMECGEGYDRSTLKVLGRQTELLEKLIATGKPVVVVLIEGRPLNLGGLEKKVNALLTAWYPGQEGGNAIADVLFGDYNPAGRLPVSVPESVGQLPVYYNHLSPAFHDYVEGSGKPLYSFGYGLSYSSFQYKDLQAAVTGKGKDMKVEVSFSVKNTGDVSGEEVCQLYVKDEVASVVTPDEQLKGFKRIFIKAGQTKQVQIVLGAEDLAIYNSAMKKVVEPGEFTIKIGASSADIRLEDKVEWKELVKLD